MVSFLSPVRAGVGKGRPSPSLRKCGLPLVLLVLMVVTLWKVQTSRLYSDLDVPLSFEDPNRQKPDSELVSKLGVPNRITNNNVSYPALSLSRGIISQNEARQLADRIAALRVGQVIFQPDYEQYNQMNWRTLEGLQEKLRSAHEDMRRPKVVLISWHFIYCALNPLCTPGEGVWMRSLLEIMKNEDIYFLVTNWENFRHVWKFLGDEIITHIWASEAHILYCFNDRQRCLQGDDYPKGVPPHKLFAFTFFGSTPGTKTWEGAPYHPWSFNPLGSEWNLVPYQMPEGHFYLGYNYQSCSSIPVVPQSERKNQIVVLAKQTNYFYEDPAFDPKTFYIELRRRTGMDIVTTATVYDGYPIPPGLTALGTLTPEEYDKFLAESKVVLGISRPILSPTPFASLCRGVPTIMPFKSKIEERNKKCSAAPSPDDWCGFDITMHQHGPAGLVGEPYIYMVDSSGPREDIFEAIQRAVSTPINHYEVPEMTYKAVEQRLLDYFAIDWEEYASEKLKSGLISSKLELEGWIRKWIKNNRDPERPNL